MPSVPLETRLISARLLLFPPHTSSTAPPTMNTSRGLTQPRKRTTPRLGSPSIYSPDVLGYETITQDYWETDAIPSIRIVEPSDTEERTIRFPPASPSNSSTSAG